MLQNQEREGGGFHRFAGVSCYPAPDGALINLCLHYQH
jgi:hypothetical protein